MTAKWRVGLSRDLRAADGSVSWGDVGLVGLTGAGMSWEFLEADDGELTAQHIAGFDAVIFAAPVVSAATVGGADRPTLLARFGVGLDAVDLAACTASGVAVTITPDGARRPVATAALTLILACLHHLGAKDRLVREGRWDERMSFMGRGLTGRRVGVVGLGNIALELLDLLAPFETVNLAADPFRSPRGARGRRVELVDLDALLEQCEIVVIAATLTAQTHHLIDARRIALMPAGAVLINVARGAIVDTDALADALADGRLGGAGLDVFEEEPVPVHHRLLSMQSVVLSPHSLAWTDEMALGNGSSAVRSILDVHAGRVPRFLANRDVLLHSLFRDFRPAAAS